MSSINKVILIGELGDDPELSIVDNGPLVKFTLITAETVTRHGAKTQHIERHNIVFFRAVADVAFKVLTKGKLIYLEGKLRTQSYLDKQGVKQYNTEIIADNFRTLGRGSDFEEAPSKVASYEKAVQA